MSAACPGPSRPSRPPRPSSIGGAALAFFKVTNNGDHPITGRAAYNVAPEAAGAYFVKTQCFCFTDQTIPAAQTVRVPGVYFVEPGFAQDRDTDGWSRRSPCPTPSSRARREAGDKV